MYLFNVLRPSRRGASPRRWPAPNDRGRQPHRLVLETLEDRNLLSYSFTLIAETGTEFRSLSGTALNDAGTVAFRATRAADGTDAIYVGDGDRHMETCGATDPGERFDNPTINGTENVAFRATRAGGTQVVYRGGCEELADTAAPDSPYRTFGSGPQINDADEVSFLANLRAPIGAKAVMRFSGEKLTSLYDTVTHFQDILSVGPGLNNQGTVALIAQSAAGTGIFTGDGGELTTIADTSDAFSGVRPAILNDAGTVAFRATLRSGGQAILKGDGGELHIVALTGGVFAEFLGEPQGIGFNNFEGVAFLATLRDGETGIFSGPNPVRDKVIVIGDELFGSTVTSLSFGNYTLNDAGQIAIRVDLTDGRRVIVRADPARGGPGTGLPPLAGWTLEGLAQHGDAQAVVTAQTITWNLPMPPESSGSVLDRPGDTVMDCVTAWSTPVQEWACDTLFADLADPWHNGSVAGNLDLAG